MNPIVVWIATVVLIACSLYAQTTYSLDEVIHAIDYVESSHNDNVKDGDGGLARGRLQIHEGYWIDAIEKCPSIGGTYNDCRQFDYAKKIFVAYMQRYHAIKKDQTEFSLEEIEIIARKHNGGGVSGHKKQATIKYWLKVKEALEHQL